MIPVEGAETLRAEAKALRAEVREVVAILENWNADRHRNHAGREVRPLPAASAPDEGPAGGDRAQNGGQIGRILTPCRTPDPALRPDPNPWYYLKILKCVHLLNMSEQVRKVTNAHECNDVKRGHTAKPTAKKHLYEWRTNSETTTGQTRREEPTTGKFLTPRAALQNRVTFPISTVSVY